MRNRVLHYLVLALLVVALLASLACLVTLPLFMSEWLWFLGDSYSPNTQYQSFMTWFVVLLGAGASYIIFELIRISLTLNREPFDMRNARTLKRIGICGVLVSALFTLKAVLYITPLTVICALILLICGLFALVLGNVFVQAVLYKQDHDLTI